MGDDGEMADAPDYPHLWPWELIDPEGIAEVLCGFRKPWWICGGWALDLFLGRETRRHDDLDVALLRDDQLALFRHLRAWDLRYATPAHVLEPWDGRPLELPIHGIWARRSTDPNASWTCEFLLNEVRAGQWCFRRNPDVRRPLDELGDERNGVPFLRPEIVLLYKSSDRSPKNEADLAAVLPRLTGDATLWLRTALERCEDRHPWIERLA